MESLPDILERLRIPAAGETLLVVGVEQPPGMEDGAVTCLGRLGSAGDIPPELRVDTALVIDQLEHLDTRAGAHLLSKLRDVHCKRVFLVVPDACWSQPALLALGFTRRQADKALGAELYLYEPEVFNPPREWNNARDWANPENFRKYRW